MFRKECFEMINITRPRDLQGKLDHSCRLLGKRVVAYFMHLSINKNNSCFTPYPRQAFLSPVYKGLPLKISIKQKG